MQTAAARLAKFPYNVMQAARNGSPRLMASGVVYVAEFGGYDCPTIYKASESDVLAFKACEVAAHTEWLTSQGIDRPIPRGWGGH